MASGGISLYAQPSEATYSVLLTDFQQTINFQCFDNCTCFFNNAACIATATPPTDWAGCQWVPPNHGFFQAANTFLLLSYLAPNGIFGILFLRVVLWLGSLFFCLWAGLVLCSPDTLVWNMMFGVINAVQACLIIHKVFPVKFTAEEEEVYQRLFKPLHVPRHSFKHLIAIATKESLQEGDYYATEGVTLTDSLSLLFCGSLDVFLKGELLHHIGEYQFIDSPEYLSFAEDHHFQVSLVAGDECWFFRWERSRLKKLFQKEAYLRAIIENMAGRDVAEKLFVLNKIIMRQSDNESTDIRMPSILSLHLSPPRDSSPSKHTGLVMPTSPMCEVVDQETVM